jgi:hypothetical protein
MYCIPLTGQQPADCTLSRFNYYEGTTGDISLPVTADIPLAPLSFLLHSSTSNRTEEMRGITRTLLTGTDSQDTFISEHCSSHPLSFIPIWLLVFFILGK